jgi:succinate dehydrogenase/fumarate reductase flavoprotein subunit
VPTLFEGDYATAEGISYLDAKHLLMLSYCINIVFYLLLKSEGKPVRDHPVVLRLVEIRTYLEKLRPIDRKLQYQVSCVVHHGMGYVGVCYLLRRCLLREFFGVFWGR